MLKKFCVIVAAFLSLSLLWMSPVSALEPGDIVTLLNPSERDLELEPGQTYESNVTVSNVGRLPFDVKVSVSPYYVSNNDYEPDFESESDYTKLYNWIILEQETYHVEPGEEVVVNFTVNVPEGVAGGGQYAAIMLLSDSGIEETSAVRIQGQLAAIIYGHVNGGEMVQSGTLVEHSLPSFVLDDKPFILQTVKNTGNVDFRVKQTMTITDIFNGREVVNAESLSNDGRMMGYNIATVLPNTSRTGILTWDDAPKLGIFRVEQQISFLDQDYTFTQLVFLCPVWLIIVASILLIALIIWICLKCKSKKARHNSEII